MFPDKKEWCKNNTVMVWFVIFFKLFTDIALTESYTAKLVNKWDSSCHRSPPPDIPNGKLIRVKQTKSYLKAEYKCLKGYKQTKGTKLFCSKARWLGEIICQKTGRTTKPTQNACEAKNLNCDHFCDSTNGEAQCQCYKGFKLYDNQKCLGTTQRVEMKTIT